MNCVNCGCRLTFFNETDELWAGTERSLCDSCRKKIKPFLEEAPVGTHLDHLHDRKAALISRGVTAEGYAHLDEYCRYLDNLRAKPELSAPEVPEGKQISTPTEERVSAFTALRRSLKEEDPPEESVPGLQTVLDVQLRSNRNIENGLSEISASLSDQTRLLSEKLERTQERLRLLAYLAATGAGTGVLSFLTVLLLLILR